MESNFEEKQKLDKLIKMIEQEEAERQKLEEAALPKLIEEGFPVEGGTTYPPVDYPREEYVSPHLKAKVLRALSQAGYNFQDFEEAWGDEDLGITIYFNWAPLWRVPEGSSDFEEEGWGRIFVDAFDRAQDVGHNQARLEAGRIARIIKSVPGIKGKHFVGVVLCEGL